MRVRPCYCNKLFYYSARFIRHKTRVDLPRNPFTRVHFLSLFAARTNQYKTSGNNLSRLRGDSRTSIKYFRAYSAGIFGPVAGPGPDARFPPGR